MDFTFLVSCLTLSMSRGANEPHYSSCPLSLSCMFCISYGGAFLENKIYNTYVQSSSVSDNVPPSVRPKAMITGSLLLRRKHRIF